MILNTEHLYIVIKDQTSRDNQKTIHMDIRRHISPGLLAILITFGIKDIALSQPARPGNFPSERFSASITASHFGDDPAIGAELSLPLSRNKNYCFRVKVNNVWFEAYKAVQDHWVTYRSFSAALVRNLTVMDRSRAFIEVGGFGITPAKESVKQKFEEGFGRT